MTATKQDPLAHVRVGDPNPLGHRIRIRICGEQQVGGYGHVCTREANHPGQHIATTPTAVVAVWPAADGGASA